METIIAHCAIYILFIGVFLFERLINPEMLQFHWSSAIVLGSIVMAVFEGLYVIIWFLENN